MVHVFSQLRKDQDFVFQINTSCILSYYVRYVLRMLKLKILAATLQHILYIALLNPRLRLRAELCEILPSTAQLCTIAVKGNLTAIKITPYRS